MYLVSVTTSSTCIFAAIYVAGSTYFCCLPGSLYIRRTHISAYACVYLIRITSCIFIFVVLPRIVVHDIVPAAGTAQTLHSTTAAVYIIA